MDWSRAKTILIIIFVCLNIFLLYNVYRGTSRIISVNDQEINDIVSILGNNNITMNASIPRRIHPKKLLEVQDISFDNERIANSFLEDSEVIIVKDEDKTTYVTKSGERSLEIYNNKRINYKNSNPSDDITGYNKNKIIEYVQKYLKDKNLYLPYMELKGFNSNDSGYDVSFNQVYKSSEIFVSHINVKLTNSGIVEFDCYWLNPIRIKDDSNSIVKSPIQILLNFAKTIKNSENIVVDKVELGYYFPVENYNNTLFTATPAWKIQINSGEIFYYNAYEGYLEYTNYKG